MDDLIGGTAADAVREYQKVEAGTKVISLSGAPASIGTFGTVTTREMNRAEKAAEKMVRQIERQVEVFGKSASEVRQMRAEMRALAAEDQGLTEVAGRLRAANADMNRLDAGLGGVGAASARSRSAEPKAERQATMR